MRILYFAPHKLWPLTTGARLRDYHLARTLASRCELTFLEVCHPGDDAGVEPLASAGFAKVISVTKGRGYTLAKVLQGLLGRVPLTVLNCYSSQVSARLARVLREGLFDAVQLEGVQLSEYLPVVRAAPSRPVVLMDWHNIESELMWRYAERASLPKRLVARRTAGQLETTENRLLAACEAHTVVSMRDRTALLARCSVADIHSVPNGVDVSYFSAAKPWRGCQLGQQGGGERRSVVFVGSMDYHANIDAVLWFSRNVWAELAERRPDLDFVIVGRSPSAEILALRSDRVRVTGTVDDVRPFYESALAAIVPLRVGSGTRLKVLEAMAAGVPVVSTRLGVEGIALEPEVHFLAADSAREMLEAIRRLADSPEIGHRLSVVAREFVIRNHDWTTIGAHLFEIHQDLHSRRVSQIRGTPPGRSIL